MPGPESGSTRRNAVSSAPSRVSSASKSARNFPSPHFSPGRPRASKTASTSSSGVRTRSGIHQPKESVSSR